MSVGILLVNIKENYIVDQYGWQWPIVKYFDFEGDLCEAEDALAAVAGLGEYWISFKIMPNKDKRKLH